MITKEKNKKGVMKSTLVRLLVVILSAVIIIIFFGTFSDLFGKTINEETCRDSILIRSSILAQGPIVEGLTQLPPLRCQTAKYCLSMGGKCPKDYNVVPITEKEEIKEKIADWMYDCWKGLERGQKDFLGLRSGTSACILCSIITFDDEVQKKVESVAISNYLQEKEIPYGEFKGQKYLEYLSNKEGSKFNIKTKIEPQLSTKLNYAISFLALRGVTFKESAINTGMCTTGGAAGGAAAGAVIGWLGGPGGAAVGALAGALAGLVWCGGNEVWAAGETYFSNIVEEQCASTEGCNGLFILPFDAGITQYCVNPQSII